MKDLLPEIRVEPRRISELVSKIRSSAHNLGQAEARARAIVDDVRKRGDRALIEYTRKFEGVRLPNAKLRVAEPEIEEARRLADRGLISALKFALKRLETTQGRLLRRLAYSTESGGFAARLVARPLSSVGCYIPGGRAAYASTVLMTAGLAKIAGVERISICTPPDADGRVSASILAAASLCGVNRVYRVGGAQAIAAMAYGTETIQRVDKIVGPGGIYVAAAKKIVSTEVATDFFAGPTELVIAADESADATSVAWDLIGQSEHGKDSICGLVTWSSSAAKKVRQEVSRIAEGVKRREHVEGCLKRGFAAICEDCRSAADLINALAPEHLQVMTRNPRRFATLVRNAGLILLGEYSPTAASDYCVGTDHVIPTEGFATIRGGLSALDFVKTIWAVEGSREGLQRILRPLRALTNSEGLPNHYLSVESRFTR